MLFDWLVVGQVVSSNPASVVRGPSHIVNRGRTPILSPEEAHQLFDLRASRQTAWWGFAIGRSSGF
jgi:hypothetical protein